MDTIRTAHPLHLPRKKSYVTDGPVEFSMPLAVHPSKFAERVDRTDGLLALLLGIVVGVACLVIADTIPSFLLQSIDFWFEADTLREVSNMTRVHANHYRTSVHPLFSLLTFIPVYAVRHGLSMSPVQAVLLVTSVIGGLWSGTLYVLLRLLGCRKPDAFVFTLLGVCSASALFWLPVPNSFSWGSLTIMFALVLLLLAEQRTFGAAVYVVASALTLSVTVTNWMAGLLVTLVRWPWRQAAQLSVNALCLVVLLWGVQKVIFPSAEFFIGSRGETSYINHPQAGTATNVASSFVFHSLIAPAVRFIKDDAYTQINDDSFRLSERLTFQFSSPGSAGPLGVIAVGIWSALLLNGLWRLLTLSGHVRFRLVLGLLLVSELALHMLYGEETFTYSLNFVPLLIAVAALGALSPGRPLVLGLASLLVVCAGINNWQQFRGVVESATQFTPQRTLMTSMMRSDPDRLWPRSVGHVPLAVPGTPEGGAAYHEPGGDFSPRTPSFGVSLWLCDDTGRPVVNSETVPLSEIQQKFAPSTHPQVPSIATRTPYYDATWSRLDATRWELRFKNYTTHVPAILIRSVGPAGGPVTSLIWNGAQVAVNHRWAVSATPSPGLVVLGDENAAEWMTEQVPGTSWSGESGWGYARLTFRETSAKVGDEIRVVLSDLQPQFEMKEYFPKAPERARMTLPDPRFQASMDAQITHLMMSLVDNETRPGDPVLFYRAWHRPGAYITTGLARAGDPHISRVLSTFLATHDFGGGSGAEADAPGLAIWALTESATYIADPVHDDWIWPHILRKIEWIERMLTARAPVPEPFSKPSPQNLNHGRQTRTAVLAQPTRDGLIVGRVGQEWPLLYVNAISYRGLLAAADFADRLGKRQHAVRWRTQAQALRKSWERQALPGAPDAPVSSASVSSVVPTASSRNQLGQPLPTYRPPADNRGPAGELARSHLALRSGQPQAVWATLHQLWNHQASPGLYTWDAPRPPIEDVVDGWQFARGWHNESVISPDYETAALLLQLQQDMLAYVDEAAAEPTVVIGAGVIPSWLSQPMVVSGLALPGGSVDWQWNGHAMRVTLRGPSRLIRLGAAFPSGTEFTVVQGSPTS